MYREPLPEKYRILAVDHQVKDISGAVLAHRDQIETGICRSLFDWWQSHALPDGSGTPWAAFDVLTLRDIAPHLFLLKVIEQGAAFQFCIHGDFVLRLFGQSCLAKETVTPDPEQPNKTRLFRHYEKGLSHGLPLRSQGLVCSPADHQKQLESIDLPLVDETGNVTRFIGAIDFL